MPKSGTGNEIDFTNKQFYITLLITNKLNYYQIYYTKIATKNFAMFRIPNSEICDIAQFIFNYCFLYIESRLPILKKFDAM